jgi:hypothetical protein
MKLTIWWGILVMLIVCRPAWAEKGDVAPVASSLLPSLAYQEGPFEPGATAINIDSVMGGKSGYLHPYLALGEQFTDNLFNREYHRKSDFITRITPGVWMALPASRFQPLRLTTLNTAPGGLALSRFSSRGKTRLQAYGRYQADMLFHNHYDDEDQINQRGDGFFRYNFRGGLSLELLDIYRLDHDAYGTGTSRELEKFRSNLINAQISYTLGPKTNIQVEYGFYTLGYDDNRYAFRDRDDHRFGGRFFYRLMPKTAFFVEYDFITIDYDKDILSDSDEHQIYGGMQWEQTAKSRWRLMVGYGVKDFDASDKDETTNLSAEIQFRHRCTPKTYLELRASRKTNETEIADTDFMLSHRVQLRYFQRFTVRFLASVNLSYQRSSYRGESAFGKRKDDSYGAGIDLKYTLTRWLAVAGGYSFLKRNSNFMAYDYDRNSIYLNLVFSL